MANTAIIVDGYFGNTRHALPSIPTNQVPPRSVGVHPFLTSKYDFANGVITGAYSHDLSMDFRVVSGYGKPTIATGSAGMGGRPVMLWPTTPTPRIAFENYMYIPINRCTFHMVYTVNGVDGGSGNRCIYSFMDKEATKFLAIYGTASGALPARITTGTGTITKLAVNTLTTKSYEMSFAPAVNRKEVLSITYDGSVANGTFTVFRNGVQINSWGDVGQFVFDGYGYLGTDVRSGTNSSDFKGELGGFYFDEKVRTPAEIVSFYNYMNAMFAA